MTRFKSQRKRRKKIVQYKMIKFALILVINAFFHLPNSSAQTLGLDISEF